jgi:pimeloyl-ACP methyl ester carboxylesterase
MSRRHLAIVLAMTVAPAACSDHAKSPPEAFSPSFEEVECPEDITLANLAPLTCGYLTTLENRAEPDGTTVKTFVVRTDPPDEEPLGVVLSIDNDLGASGGMGAGPGAARTHSVVYQINPRGTGRSEPSLACPEVEAVAVEAAEAPSASPEARDHLLAAVGECHDRLVAHGIDPAAYDTEQSAQDIEDLRQVLGVERWNLTAQGTYSRYQLEVARRWPEHVGYMFFDSPQFPGAADPDVAVTGLDYAFEQLTAACAAAPACATATPDLAALLKDATARLDQEPVTFIADVGHLATAAGRPVTVLVDGAKLLRAVRATLGGDGPDGVLLLPGTIAAAARGEVSGQLKSILGYDSLLCTGYRPLCNVDPDAAFSMGVYLTTLCRDQAPFIDLAASDDNPYLAACDAWDVPAASPAVNEPVSVDIPTLVFSGQFDSFSPAPLARAAVEHLPNGYAFEIPKQTHNVMGFGECQIEIRNAWVQHPEAPPADTSCLDDLRATPVPFRPPG